MFEVTGRAYVRYNSLPLTAFKYIYGVANDVKNMLCI